MKQNILVPLTCLVIAALLGLGESAQAEVIDQANDQYMCCSYFFGILTGHAEGQSFIPTLSGVDFVRFYLKKLTGQLPAIVDLVVDLHHETPTSPVLATSAPVRVQGPYTLFVQFIFPSTVPLVPGDTYVFMLRYVGGTAGWGLGATGDYYPRGQLIGTLGSPHLYDAWFQEGLDGPIGVESSSWGQIRSLYR